MFNLGLVSLHAASTSDSIRKAVIELMENWQLEIKNLIVHNMNIDLDGRNRDGGALGFGEFCQVLVNFFKPMNNSKG